MDLLFTNNTRRNTIEAAYGILQAQARSRKLKGDYPGHEGWLEATRLQLQFGEKSLVLATWDDRPVGSAIYKAHPTDPALVEIRNLAVKGSGDIQQIIIRSLLDATVLAASIDFPHATRMIGDTKVTNEDLIDLLHQGEWMTVGTATLVSPYGSNGVPDTVLTKDLPGHRRTRGR